MRRLLLGLLLWSGRAHALEPSDQARVWAPKKWALGWAARRPEFALVASDASGTPQLYVVDLKKGRWSQVTDESSGRRRGALSPDGQSAAFLRDVMGSEIGQLFRASARGGSEEALVPGFPAKSISDASFGPTGRHVYFAGSDRSGFGVYQFALGGRRAFTLAFSTLEIAGLAASEDERYLAFHARSEGGDLDVRIVDLASGGEAGQLAAAPGSSEAFFAWAREEPFGRLLVASDAGGKTRPGIWDVAAGSTTWLDPGLAGDVEALDWYPGSQELLLRQTEDGKTALWRWDPAGAPSRLEGVRGRVGWARIRPDGTLWANVESGESPPNVVDAEGRPALPAQGKARPASGRAARWVEVPLADGTKLDGWLLGPSTPAAAAVWLPDRSRGFAGDEWDPVRLALADAGLAVLAVNLRKPSFGSTAAELADAAAAREWLVRELGVSGSSVAVAGRGYGGTVALLALAQQPELWAAGASLGAVADWERLYEDASEPVRDWCRRLFASEPQDAPERWAERSPAARAFTIRAPVLLAHAAHDSRAPIGQMRAFASRLQDAGKNHRLVETKGGAVEATAADQGLFLEAFLNFLHQAGLASVGR